MLTSHIYREDNIQKLACIFAWDMKILKIFSMYAFSIFGITNAVNTMKMQSIKRYLRKILMMIAGQN